jgi:hypothetical protein
LAIAPLLRKCGRSGLKYLGRQKLRLMQCADGPKQAIQFKRRLGDKSRDSVDGEASDLFD